MSWLHTPLGFSSIPGECLVCVHTPALGLEWENATIAQAHPPQPRCRRLCSCPCSLASADAWLLTLVCPSEVVGGCHIWIQMSVVAGCVESAPEVLTSAFVSWKHLSCPLPLCVQCPQYQQMDFPPCSLGDFQAGGFFNGSGWARPHASSLRGDLSFLLHFGTPGC